MGGDKKHKEKKKKEKGPQQLPEHLEKQRKYVICGHDKNYHVSCASSPPLQLGPRPPPPLLPPQQQ